jgi:hypothetical protein
MMSMNRDRDCRGQCDVDGLSLRSTSRVVTVIVPSVGDDDRGYRGSTDAW